MAYHYIGERATFLEPIIAKLKYWRDYAGRRDDEYRRTHDLDCVLSGGNLQADTMISLWLPLRYTLNCFDTPAWQLWRELDYAELKPKGIGLKDHTGFLNNMIERIDNFLPDSELTRKLSTLFALGQQRFNVMLLPKRSWNTLRGGKPYYDYMPHFLYDLFSYAQDEEALQSWLHKENLEPFFAAETIEQRNILDLAGTGSPCRHSPKDIQLDQLLDNYIAILRRRAELLALRTA